MGKSWKQNARNDKWRKQKQWKLQKQNKKPFKGPKVQSDEPMDNDYRPWENDNYSN